ncbi:hypothetical protein HYV43_04205, partial [Candidatus Micrarchaeota archaeon]|nr:hypothetical protein [Candidatus Micrarchaeota archaeon]
MARAQGTFEYMLLLGGAVFIATLALSLLINTTPDVDPQKQCALAARQSLECFKPGGGFNDAASFNYQDRTTPCTCTSVTGTTTGTPTTTTNPTPTPSATPTASTTPTPTTSPTATP